MTKEELIKFEDGLAAEWKAGRIRVPCHLSGGDESELIQIFREIRKNDWVVSTHRNHYHYLLHGGDANALRKEILGESGGICGGRSGSMHTTDMRRHFISSCLVGCGAPVAIGLGLSIALRSGGEKVWCFVGDGAVDEGQFYEAVCFAEGRRLPVTFIVEDNDRSVESSKKERGVAMSSARNMMLYYAPNVRVVKFKSTFPHVADGSFVSF